MIGELYVLKVAKPLYEGCECLELEQEFLLTGIILAMIEREKKYGFGRRATKYKLIGDTLYMKGADLVLRLVPWKTKIYKVLEENHEETCGGCLSSKITLHKI